MRPRVVTPFVACYPESPLSANPSSPLDFYQHQTFPSIMTPTPPLSAGPVEGKTFTFPPLEQNKNKSSHACCSPVSDKSRQQQSSPPPPYAHPESLHSILRNSPLPPRTSLSPKRQSQRLDEKPARRVGYESPLTQEIITNKYTKSHIDLLLDDASPSPSSPFTLADASDIPRSAFTANEIQDGGQTPGPMEDMERKMSRFTTTSSPMAGGIRKRKRKEKKRNWVWTIGKEEDEGDDDEVGGAIAALRAEAAARKAAAHQRVLHFQAEVAPVPSIEVQDTDVCMADADLRGSKLTLTSASLPVVSGLEPEAKTPVGPVTSADTPSLELVSC